MLDLRDRAPTLITARLALRELRVEDARAIAERAGDVRVARNLIAVPQPYTQAAAARWLAARIAWWPHGRGLTLAITRREAPGLLLGTVSLRVDGARTAFSSLAAAPARAGRSAELGYWLGVDAWGRGYATEAAGALVELGLDELALDRIHAQVLAGNHASCRVLEKLGMRHEGVLRRHVRKGPRRLDVWNFGLGRAEWAAHRGR